METLQFIYFQCFLIGETCVTDAKRRFRNKHMKVNIFVAGMYRLMYFLLFLIGILGIKILIFQQKHVIITLPLRTINVQFFLS